MKNIFEHIKNIVKHKKDDANQNSTDTKANKIRINDIIGGKILVHDFILSQLPLIILFVAFSIGMIANRYYIESTSKEISKLKNDIEELKIRRIKYECDYMNVIKISEIAKELGPFGIRQSTDRPLKVKIEKE